MSDNPPESSPKAAPPLPARPIETGRFPYGWRAIPALPKGFEGGPTKDDFLLFPQFYRKEFSHAPRTILLGAPRRGGRYLTLKPTTKRQVKRCNECKPVRYIVWPDQSIRRVDKLLRKEFAGKTPEEQTAMVSKAVAA